MAPPLPNGEGVNRPPVTQYLFSHFRLDLESHQLLRGEEPVLLSAKAWDTLLVLLTNRHRVVSKDELLQLVWAGKHVSDDLLPQNILALRRALGDDSGQPKFIATTPRRGYRFIAHVTEVPDNHGRQASAQIPANGEAEAPGVPAALRVSIPVWRRPAFWVGTAIAILLVLLIAQQRGQNPSGNARPLRFTQVAPDGTTFVSGGVLSPNGRLLAFVAEDTTSGRTELWLRTLDTGDSRKLDGTDDAAKPFWSPDNQNLGFFAGGRLKRIGIDANAPRTLADVGLSPAGGTWSSRGVILFAGWKSGVNSVPEAGGQIKTVTVPNHEAQETAHGSPQFLPDGRHFLYYIASADPAIAGTYLGDLEQPSRTRIAESPVTYVTPGYLLTVRDSTLWAQSFDVTRFTATGSASAVASHVPLPAVISGAEGGLLTVGGVSPGSRLVWLNRTGALISTIDTPAHLHNPAFSADLKQLMASSSDSEQRGIWVIDLGRGVSTRMMPYGTSPLGSPDGRRIIYTSDRIGGVADVYARSTGERDEEQVVLRTHENKIVNDWTPDGRYIVYVSTNPMTRKDIWLLPQFGDQTPIPYLHTSANEIQGQVSPDGRWMAYASDESGNWQVYVQTFPTPARKRVVSVNGGAQPRWRRDGRELFYLAPDRTLMAVDIAPGETLEPGRPRALFRADVLGRLNTYRSHYAVTADGQRFLVDSANGSQPTITTLVNWTALIQR